MKRRKGRACSPKTGEERVLSSMVQEDGLLAAYFGWRKFAKVGNPALGLLRGSSGVADGAVVGESQKAVGKAM